MGHASCSARSTFQELHLTLLGCRYNAAIDKYTEAITLVNDSAVLFVNRALANR